MLSAFQPPLRHQQPDNTDDTMNSLYSQKESSVAADADETEDEEVKLNCAAGIPPDSDYYSSSADDDDDGDISTTSDTAEQDRFDMKVVNFVTLQVQQSSEILSPKVVRGRIVDSIAEGTELDDDDLSRRYSTTFCVPQSTPNSAITHRIFSTDGEDGARGLPLAPESTSGDSDDDDDSNAISEVHQLFPLSIAGHECTTDSVDDSSDLESVSSQQDAIDNLTENAPELLDLENALSRYDRATEWDKGPLYAQEIDECESLLTTSLHSSATGDDSVPTNESKPIGLLKIKRSLSRHSMLEDERTSRPSAKESPKRMRFVSSQDFGRNSLPFMPDFTLGPAALPRLSEGAVSPSTDDEIEHDRQLSEELDDTDFFQDRDCTPVPLLTPPASPLSFETSDGLRTTMCEWPCNLAVDNAMTAAFRLRPPSPNSLQTMEEEEEDRIEAYLKDHSETYSPSTTLTPLIRGIAFCKD